MKCLVGKILILFNKFIMLGEIPLITEKGTFVINGNTRVINEILKIQKL